MWDNRGAVVNSCNAKIQAWPPVSLQEYSDNLYWAQKSYRQAIRGELITCRGCECKFELLRLFRCYFCGSYFCPGCSKEHFGERTVVENES